MKRSIILTIIAIAISTTAAYATTIPGTINVSATVVGQCKWTTPLNMAFPNYDPFSAVADTTSQNINFKCVKLTKAADVYKVWFSKTAGNLVNGGNNLAYTLTIGGSATVLPTTAPTAVTVAGTPGVAGAGYTFGIDGSIAPGQDVPVGTYTDTVTANIEY